MGIGYCIRERERAREQKLEREEGIMRVTRGGKTNGGEIRRRMKDNYGRVKQ
jgi:hypothetical protein